MTEMKLGIKELIAIVMILAGAAGLYTAMSVQLGANKVRIQTIEDHVEGQNRVNVHMLDTLQKIKRDVAVIKDRQERGSVQGSGRPR